jgi:hypothetical protein
MSDCKETSNEELQAVASPCLMFPLDIEAMTVRLTYLHNRHNKERTIFSNAAAERTRTRSRNEIIMWGIGAGHIYILVSREPTFIINTQLLNRKNLLRTAVIMSCPNVGVAVFVFRSDTDNQILIGKRKGSHGSGLCYSTGPDCSKDIVLILLQVSSPILAGTLNTAKPSRLARSEKSQKRLD